jgi:hypothetical protein
MYRGFNLVLDWDNEEYYEKGFALYQTNKSTVRSTLKEFTYSDGSINGSLMQSNWFPQIESNIFISHSHKDEKQAITLAGWLYDTFKIKAFIDSCIWGYSNELLKLIDQKYCIQADGYYNYNQRNYSTSHVHMMLSTALSMMIDKTECLFFLNTPNSISTTEVIGKTESPWIYSEIAMSQMIRKSIPRRRNNQYFSKDGVINESLKIKYDVNLSHLVDINMNTLLEWQKKYISNNAVSALDILYKIKSIKDMNIIL